MSLKKLLITGFLITLSTTVSFAATTRPTAFTPSREVEQMREVIGRPIATPEIRADRATPAELRAIDAMMRQTRALQTDFVQPTTDATTMKLRAKELRQRIATMRQQVETAKSRIAPATLDGVASIFAAPTGKKRDDDAAALRTELDRLSEELAYREALIDRLLGEVDGTHAAAPSELSASLVAITDHPRASVGAGLFIIALVWLFRGRIAELSGFGVRIAFTHREEGGRKDDIDNYDEHSSTRG